jgi:hypothetical protein
MSDNPKATPGRRRPSGQGKRSMMGLRITNEARRVLEHLAANRDMTLSAYVSELAETHSARAAR